MGIHFGGSLSAALALALAPLTGLAGNGDDASRWAAVQGGVHTTEDTAAVQLQQLQQREALLLQRERIAYPRLFARAYAAYPRIPRGTLEGIAFVQSRWAHLRPEAHAGDDSHHHKPPAYGVMGLYHGDGFADQVGEAAALLGVPAERVIADPATNVLAAAALLDQQLRHAPAGDASDAAAALAAYAGFSPEGAAKSGAIDDYARASFAFDVLLALDRGVDDNGIRIAETPIEWERAFAPDTLVKLNAPLVRLNVAEDLVETEDYRIDPVSEQLVRQGQAKAATDAEAKSDDYGPAIWNAAHSSNYTASRSQAISAVTIHTAQGSYAGTISWFKNASANVSAHYVIRSSDGQVTQMVRNAHTGWHVGNHNSYTLGIEHEGYVNNASWYTSAMYNASAALVRNFCSKYSAIPCNSAYSGAASSGVVVLPTSVKIKGHQHFSGQTHTDPGINWNWGHYYSLLNPGGGGGGTTRVLDSFESNVGHFNTSPAYSGSTTGISTASTASRDCGTRRNGSCSLRVLLKDNPNTSAAWAVRLLSGSGNPGSNSALSRNNGRVGFWVWSGGSGLSVGVGIDDSDGTERSVSRSIPANQWTFVEWNLTDAGQWDGWVGNANGAITASSVTLDAIWLYRAQTSFDVNVYIDDVQIKN